MLHKRDYEIIAEALSDHNCCLCIGSEFGNGFEAGYKRHHNELVARLGEEFEKNDSLFDREKFNAACND